MLNTHLQKAAQDLTNSLSSKFASTLKMKTLSIKQVVKCDQRLFYIFELDFHNAPTNMMVIIGNYYSFDPQGVGYILDDIGSFDLKVAHTAIKSFVNNNAYSQNHALFDAQYALDNLEQPLAELDPTLTQEDAEALAEIMSVKSIHGCVLSTSGELNINTVIAAYQQLWDVNLQSLEGFAINQDPMGIKIHYQDIQVCLGASERIFDDQLLQSSAMFNNAWSEAFEQSQKSTHMFNINVDSSLDKLVRAKEFVKWAAAILVSHPSCVSVLYNYYLYEPQSYLNQALVMKGNSNAVPVSDLVWTLVTPKGNSFIVGTSGLSELGRLELVSEDLNGDQVALMQQVFIKISDFLLTNNTHLLPGNEIKLNDELVFLSEILESPEDNLRSCLIKQQTKQA